MNARDRGLRNRNRQAEQAVLRQLHDRHGLRLGGGPRLNHGAGVGVAVGDDAGERRGDPRVVEQRLRLGLIRARDGELLVRAGERGLGGGDLRFGHPIAARRIVDVLLRDEIRPLLDHAVEARRADRCASSCTDCVRSRSAWARLISSLLAVADASPVRIRPASPGPRAPPAAARR